MTLIGRLPKPAKPRRAFLLSAGSDTGGTLIRSQRAFAAEPDADWLVRSMVTSHNYIEYPEDLEYTPKALYYNYHQADVVVLNSILYGHHIYDDGAGKPAVLMHHGLHKDHFKQSSAEIIAEGEEIGVVQAGTTVNLELLGPITWVPSPVDVESLEKLRWDTYRRSDNGYIRILHAPTDRQVKSTAEVIAAVNILRMEGLPVELILLENVTNDEVLRAKARSADIFVDQLHLGYGINAIEAWAMSIPVVAGFTDHPDWEDHARRRYGISSPYSELPFASASPATLVEVLRQLVLQPELRTAFGSIGHSHALKWHTPEAHVEKMSEILDQAFLRPTQPGPPLTRLDSMEYKFQMRRKEARRHALSALA